ncbi:ATP-binding protein [Roseibium sp. CAU 1637]|uniref:ATP-binding protein n=1 Tax=Roseibium limicola TaxID=2816037 RepID=A0A939EM38_9HYPH|nr:ATP-binding protein [Roseibium limicola]
MPCRSCEVTDLKTQERFTPLARFPLHVSRDVVQARQSVARELRDRGVSNIRVTRFSTAVSEIARNVIVHGGGGEFSVYLDPAAGYLMTVSSDKGRGIADIPQALTDGFTTAGGLGRGLGGAKRLADVFEIISSADGGTTIKMGIKL